MIVDRIHGVAGEVAKELDRALHLFPSFNSGHEGWAVIREELDELWDEVKHEKIEGARTRQRKEAIQIAAMALRFVLDLCEVQHGKNCEKKIHSGDGHLHGPDDDSPYDVDGASYCGRCHRWLET